MMELHKAHSIATSICNRLAPWCDRIIIAGSIRRENVKDIEIVCIPKGMVVQYTTVQNFFGEKQTQHQFTKPCQQFIDAVNLYTKIKGDPTGRYTQRKITEQIVLDLFMCTAENWGYILAIRTGSADYSHKILGSRWVAKGYAGTDGMLYRNGIPQPIREEKELFTLCGMNYVEPRFRSIG
jgi:DNA polymerase/3'-5' exonuclease PolX